MDADDEKLASIPGFSLDQLREIRAKVLLYTEERAKVLSTLKNHFRHDVSLMEFIDSLDNQQLELLKVPGIGLKLVRHLKLSGIETLDALLQSSRDDLASKLAITEDEADLILATARNWSEKRAQMTSQEKLSNLKGLEQSVLDDSLDEQPEDDAGVVATV